MSNNNIQSKALGVLMLMRPNQWVKNLFVFLPAFLNGEIAEWECLWHILTAFLLFCLTSSAVYCVNDTVDAPYDARNPEKCGRPVASGLITPPEAIRLAAMLIIAVFCAILIIPAAPIHRLWLPMGVYLLLNLSYSLWLKRIPVLDVIIVASCFLIRVWAGGVAGPVPLTLWTLVLVFMLTLFMATGKRRHEAWLCETQGVVGRSNIKGYSLRVLNVMMTVLACAAGALYLIWSLSPGATEHFHSHRLWLTTCFVYLGLQRYLYLTLRLNMGGSPTKMILRDRQLQFAVLCWIVSFALCIYD